MKVSKSDLKFAIDKIASMKDIHSDDELSFGKKVEHALLSGLRLLAFFVLPEMKSNHKNSYKNEFYALFADDNTHTINIYSFYSEKDKFKSFTPEYPQFHLFEREIYENTGIIPEGHPCLKPLRFTSDSHSMGKNRNNIGEMDFFRVEGDEIHQVAVGPVHAGIIEPGHFRFQCFGEIVYHLEISLGYQHRGIEKHLRGGPHKNTLFQMETVSGDSTIAHSTAYCRIIEKLTHTKVPDYAEKIRAIALELERCANHIGDLGAMAGDIGYLPTMSYCGRIRGDFLNMTALICGNRFGRTLLTPGGVKHNLKDKKICELRKKLNAGKNDFISAVSLLWDTPSVLARFEDTGVVTQEDALSIGMVGVAARACGLSLDARKHHPDGIYNRIKVDVPVSDSGDVFARARVRWHEVIESIKIIEQLLDSLDEQNSDSSLPLNNLLEKNAVAVSLIEGWRGEVCHIAVTDENGKFKMYKIIDPSFHNWTGLALALRGEQISDFPICNKSFSLSYCGFDL